MTDTLTPIISPIAPKPLVQAIVTELRAHALDLRTWPERWVQKLPHEVGQRCAVLGCTSGQGSMTGWSKRILSPEAQRAVQRHLGVLYLSAWNDRVATCAEDVAEAFEATADRLELQAP